METNSTGAKQRTYVHDLGGQVIAVQQANFVETNEYHVVRWEHTDPSGVSYMRTVYNGTFVSTEGAELDPTARGIQIDPGESGEGDHWTGYGIYDPHCKADQFTEKNCIAFVSNKKPDCPPGKVPMRDDEGVWQCVGVGAWMVDQEESKGLPLEAFELFRHDPLTTLSPAPLSVKQQEKFNKSLQKIQKKITTGKCKDFLVSVFGESIAQRILDSISTQHAYSGPDSTDINVVDAGIYGPADVNRMRALANSTDPNVASRFTGLLTQSVASWFKNTNGDFDGRRFGAVTSATLPDTVFYRSFDWLKMLHESLHVISGLNDDDLATKLGVDISQFGGDSELSSASINKKLKEKGCK